MFAGQTAFDLGKNVGAKDYTGAAVTAAMAIPFLLPVKGSLLSGFRIGRKTWSDVTHAQAIERAIEDGAITREDGPVGVHEQG